MSKQKIFLGGSCNGSTWREELIPLLTFDYFDPTDGNPFLPTESHIRLEKNICEIHLYIVTSGDEKAYNLYSEIMESSKNPDKRCVLYISTWKMSKEFEEQITGFAKNIAKLEDVFMTNSSYDVKTIADIVENGGENYFKMIK